MQGDDAKVLDYLRRLCSVREYCRRDIYDKALTRLQKKSSGCEGDDASLQGRASALVDTLIGEGFLDETRYACAFCRDKSSIRGWGPVKIRSALMAKGVSSDVIDGALAQIDDSKADEKLRKAIETKARSLSSDPQIRLKLLRFGLSRGYPYDKINGEISEILKKFS